MRRLRDDINLTRRGGAAPPRRALRSLLVILVLVSLALLGLSRLHHPLVRDARARVAEWLTPLMSAASVQLAPVRWARRQLVELSSLALEAERLRHENQRLKAADSRALELERRMDDLARLAKLVPERAQPSVTARVVAVSTGAFVRTFTIAAGIEQGVGIGFPAIGAAGVLGRVIDAGPASARILLLTDLNSRVPVVVGRGSHRAVLSGDNGPRPRLEFVAPDAVIAVDDEVVTSGAGGIFPRGLGAGRVVKGPDGWRVELHADPDRTEFVSVLLHATPLLEIDGAAARAESDGLARRADVPLRAPGAAEWRP